ncbi:MAG: TlpA disulfide reductase family protein, partial [Bacteroidota bacterium]
HFKLTEKYYYANGQDTTITPFEVWVVRDNNDTLRGGYIWVDNNYRPYNMIYDTGNFYLAIPPKKTSILYANFTESLISQVDWIDIFLKPDIFQEQINDSLNNTIISDTVYQEEQCSKIVIEFPVSKNGESKKYTYVLSKKHYAPVWAMLESKSKDDVYFDELYFTDYEFDKVNIEKLKEDQKQVLIDNPIERDGANSEAARLEKMLHLGDKAPLFEGNFYLTEEAFKLDGYIGKNVIVVDFWYTHCPPCVKAMPALSELYSEYKDLGLKVFGLNSVDNQPHSLDNLDKFLSKRQTSYDMIMIEPNVDIMYKVNGYPTMYIIDKDGDIAFAEIGFDEEKFEDFKNKIEELLVK